MPGDPANARLWVDADVYVTFDLDATLPATEAAAFPAEWSLVGLLDGDDGFVESRSEDVSDSYAWGGILMRTIRKNFKMTKSFTAFEANEVVNRLRYPGSTTTTIHIPRIERCKIAFETRDGAITRRVISANYAEVAVDGDTTEAESDVSSVKFVATIYPDVDGVLFTVQPAMDYLVDA